MGRLAPQFVLSAVRLQVASVALRRPLPVAGSGQAERDDAVHLDQAAG